MIIKDNFLPKPLFDQLQNQVLSADFPWYYSAQVSLPPGQFNFLDPLAKETDGFNHRTYDREDSNMSFFFQQCRPFFECVAREFGYTHEKLIRARFSMKHPRVGWKEEYYNLPHVDYFYPHDTIIYYLNDSDGDTRIFEEFFTGFPEKDLFKTQQRIKPVANRLVLFNGLQYHTAANPIESTRRVIFNINLDPL
jgi:hypothetical protein